MKRMLSISLRILLVAEAFFFLMLCLSSLELIILSLPHTTNGVSIKMVACVLYALSFAGGLCIVRALPRRDPAPVFARFSAVSLLGIALGPVLVSPPWGAFFDEIYPMMFMGAFVIFGEPRWQWQYPLLYVVFIVVHLLALVLLFLPRRTALAVEGEVKNFQAL